jgi:hypothetical protein
LQLKEKIAAAVREQIGESMDVERIMVAKNEEVSQGSLVNYLMDDKTVEHYSLETGSMVNIYFWTGSNVLANGQPVRLEEPTAEELEALKISAES